MVYSKWRPDLQHYEYYQDSLGVSDDGPIPKAKGVSQYGAALGDISWKLPAGVKYVGTGTQAKGIVVHPNATSGFDFNLPALGLLIIAFGVYKLLT